MGAGDCTSCDGTCSDSLSSCQLDISGLTACQECGKSSQSSSTITMVLEGTCPNPMWIGVGSISGCEIHAKITYDSTEDCYVLTLECFTAPAPPTFIASSVTMWVGCKGGSDPTGSYTRNGGCDTTSSLSVS